MKHPFCSTPALLLSGCFAKRVFHYKLLFQPSFSGKLCTFRKNTNVLNIEKQIEYWINSAKSDLDSLRVGIQISILLSLKKRKCLII